MCPTQALVRGPLVVMFQNFGLHFLLTIKVNYLSQNIKGNLKLFVVLNIFSVGASVLVCYC